VQTTRQIVNAGQTMPLNWPGKYFQVFESYAPIDVRFFHAGRVVYVAEQMDAGFYVTPDGGFDRVEIVSATQQAIKVGISDGTGGTNRMTGDVAATIRGASAVLNKPILSVGAAETPLVAARADRVAFRVLNSGATNIAIGGPGLTYAGAVLVLAAGDIWQEETAPGAAWVALGDAAGGVLKVQELLL